MGFNTFPVDFYLYLQHFLIFSKVLLFYIFFFNPLLKTSPNGEYSNLALSATPGLYPRYSPVKYSYLSNYLVIFAAFLSKSN